MPTDEQVADDLRAVRANLAEAEEAARVAKMSETVEVSLVRCAELFADAAGRRLGPVLRERLEALTLQERSFVRFDALPAGRVVDVEAEIVDE